MKIAIICFAIFVCAVCAYEEGDNAAITRHEGHDGLQGNGYVVYGSSQGPVYRSPQPQPRPYGPQPQGPGLLQNPLLLILLLGLLNPSTTTAETTTVTATTTATPNPFEGWTKVGNCYYLLSDTTATWNAAQNECAGAIANGRLAVTGFEVTPTERTALIGTVGATGVTFFIGTDGVTSDCTPTPCTLASEAFIEPSDGTLVTGGDPAFNTELADSVTENGAVCGRVDAADDDTLVYEDCDTTARRYMCEVCMA